MITNQSTIGDHSNNIQIQNGRINEVQRVSIENQSYIVVQNIENLEVCLVKLSDLTKDQFQAI
jgi:hypothetical protein